MADGIVEFILRLKDEASAGMERATGEAEELSEAQKEVAAASKLSRAELLGFAGAAIGAAASVAALVKDVVDARNALLDASTRTGVAAETLNGLKLAAEGSGLGFEAIEGAMAGYTARLVAVSRGSKEAEKAFDDLEVKLRETKDGPLRDTDAILRDTLEALNGVSDGGDRARLAMAAFGEQGGKLLQALGGGSLEEFVEVANRYGIKVGPEAAKASGDWQRSMAALQLAFDGAKASIVESFGGISGMTDGMLMLGEALIAGAALFGIWKDGLIALLLPIRTLVGGFMTLGGVMLAAMSGDFQAALDIGKGGLQDIADNAVAAAETLTDIPGRLTAVVAGFGDFSADMRGLMGSAGSSPGGGGGPAPAVTVVDEKAEKEKIDEVAKALDELSAGAFDLLFPIESGLRSLEAAFLGMARRMGQQIGGILSGNISGALRAGVEAAGRGVGSLIGGVGGGAVGGIVGAGIGGALQGLGSLGSEGAGAMVGKISKSIDAIANGIEELPDFIVRLAERLPDLLMTLVTSLLVNLPKILTALLVKLPVHFAQGLIDWWRGVWAEIKAWFRDLFTIGSSGDGRAMSDAERAAFEDAAARRDALSATGGVGGYGGDANSFVGSRDIGGLIPQTGLYLMHAGETVIRGREQGPNSGSTAAAGRAAGMSGGGAGVTVNVYTPVADSNFADYIVREFERMFGAGGLRSSSVFGG